VNITDIAASVSLFPNPAKDQATITITATPDQPASIRVMDINSNSLYYQKLTLGGGVNTIGIPVQPSWPAGVYIVQVSIGTDVVNKKLVIKK
jgi:hypothetical protein